MVHLHLRDMYDSTDVDQIAMMYSFGYIGLQQIDNDFERANATLQFTNWALAMKRSLPYHQQQLAEAAMILFYIFVAVFMASAFSYQIALLVLLQLQVPSVVAMKWWELYAPTLGPVAFVGSIVVLMFVVAIISAVLIKPKPKTAP